MGWNYLSIYKLLPLYRWILWMDKLFHPTLHNGCNKLSLLGFKSIYICKRGPKATFVSQWIYIDMPNLVWKTYSFYTRNNLFIHPRYVKPVHNGLYDMLACGNFLLWNKTAYYIPFDSIVSHIYQWCQQGKFQINVLLHGLSNNLYLIKCII